MVERGLPAWMSRRAPLTVVTETHLAQRADTSWRWPRPIPGSRRARVDGPQLSRERPATAGLLCGSGHLREFRAYFAPGDSFGSPGPPTLRPGGSFGSSEPSCRFGPASGVPGHHEREAPSPTGREVDWLGQAIAQLEPLAQEMHDLEVSRRDGDRERTLLAVVRERHPVVHERPCPGAHPRRELRAAEGAAR